MFCNLTNIHYDFCYYYYYYYYWVNSSGLHRVFGSFPTLIYFNKNSRLSLGALITVPTFPDLIMCNIPTLLLGMMGSVSKGIYTFTDSRRCLVADFVYLFYFNGGQSRRSKNVKYSALCLVTVGELQSDSAMFFCFIFVFVINDRNVKMYIFNGAGGGVSFVQSNHRFDIDIVLLNHVVK